MPRRRDPLKPKRRVAKPRSIALEPQAFPKPTRVRLYGWEKTELRRLVYERAGGAVVLMEFYGKKDYLTSKPGRCEKCKAVITWMTMHLAHLKGTGAGGADTPENTRAWCYDCHIVDDHAGGKPCPPKPKLDS